MERRVSIISGNSPDPGRNPRALLLHGVSLTALIAALGPSPARAAPFRSLTQALASSRAPVAAATTGGGVATARAARLGVQNFAAAAARISSLSQALNQAAAHAAAQPATVQNGWLVPGGLQPAAGYSVAGSGTFQGVTVPNLPAGATNVTITQTVPKAVLNWQTFNVGNRTTVTFDQSAGGSAASTWSVLNRIEDPSGSPTQILGSIRAQGEVWVLNRNGVLFGAGSQVSLHSLVAGAFSTTDTQFLSHGLYASGTKPPFTAGPGAVLVEPGASIVTAAPASAADGGGSVILLGATAENDGLISTPDGQTILGGGQSFLLRPGYSAASSGGSTAGNTSSTVLGSEIETEGPGAATNGAPGLIQATTGDITLVGETVTQAGVLHTTSSVSRRGTIHLLTPIKDTRSSVTFAPGSVTAITPDAAPGQALASAQQAKYTPQTANGTNTPLLNDQAQLADQPGYSRIEVTTGGIVDFGGQSLTLAPGGQIAVSAAGRIFAQSGAQLDASGLSGVTLPIASNLLSINIQGSQLADSPLNRDSGLLSSNTVVIDARTLVEVPASAADPQNRYYTQGGLLNVTGEAGQVNSTIAQWLTVGGQITLNSPEVVAQPGSVFNIAGGTTGYQAGYVPQSYLIGSDGLIYNVNTAPANLTYTGVYRGFIVDHKRWDVVDVYNNPLLYPAQVYQTGYTEGADGGRLLLSTPTAAFEGDINAGAEAGTQQVAARPSAVADPFLLTQQTAPLAGSLALEGSYGGTITTLPTNVTIGSAAGVASSLTATSALPAGVRNTAVLDASQLDGLGGVTIAVGQASRSGRNGGSVSVDAPLTLAPGAALAIEAPVVTIGGAITTRGGSVTVLTEDTLVTPVSAFSLVDRGTITVAPGVTIDTRGTWTNALLDPAATPSLATVNGGNVDLTSTGLLELSTGSTIDASAGGLLTAANRFTGGHGGNITLVGDDPAFDYASSAAAAQRAYQPVVLDGVLRSYGATSGGTFSLAAPSVVIGASAIPVNDTQVALGSGFFSSGFGSYSINGFGQGSGAAGTAGVTVLAGTDVAVTEKLLVFGQGSAQWPTGTDPETALPPTLPPQYLLNIVTAAATPRPGASLSLLSAAGPAAAKDAKAVLPGGVTVAAGASLAVDPGQKITLSSPSEVIVDGTITAPSGTISVLNSSQNAPFFQLPAAKRAALSVWIGGTAKLDVSGVAYAARAENGSTFGVVPQGGSIIIGAPTDPRAFETDRPSTDAFIFVRPGATLSAAGASLGLDIGTLGQNSLPAALAGQGVQAGGRVSIASNGGTISFSSDSGIYLDGTVAAPAGGASAEGGTLGIEMEVPAIPNPTKGQKSSVIPALFFAPRRIVVSTDSLPDFLPADLGPGDGSFLRQPGLAGQAAVSEQQISAGGFGNLFLLARDQIVFDQGKSSGVSLSLGQSAILTAFAFSDATKTGNVSIAAPTVSLSGAANLATSYADNLIPGLNDQGAVAEPSKKYQPCLSASHGCAAGTFTVSADQIDLSRNVRFGVSGTETYTGQGTILTAVDSPGFNAVDLASAGDIRFVPPSSGTASIPTATSSTNSLTLAVDSLVTTGDLTLSAARIYPDTGVSAVIGAGFVSGAKPAHQDPSTSYYADSLLTIAGAGDGGQQTPYSVFGQMTFLGETIEQGGVLDAPLGTVNLGPQSGAAYAGLPDTPTPGARIDLLAGSTISVSANGATIPFGGTTDGLTYAFDGQQLKFTSAVYGASARFGQQSVSLAAIDVQGDAGSTLDLRGGGTLTGGGGEILIDGGTQLQSQGFIAGRGGSTDVLYSPLLILGAAPAGSVAAQPTLAQDPVYAILPGLQGGYAPTTLLDATAAYAGSVPATGEQVTIGAGVPGLAAGTYTLLPSYYALLPGGYRVQLGAAVGAQGLLGAQATLDGSYAITGTTGIANTGLRSMQPQELLITSGAVVRTFSQYDEQTYAATAVASTSALGDPRPYLPQDAGQIDLQFLSPRKPPSGGTLPLDFAGTALLAAAPGGYDGGVIVTPEAAPIEILGSGAPTKGYVSLTAASLDAFKAPLLLIDGDFTSNLGFTTLLNPQTNETVVVRAGADLTGGAVWLFGTGTGGVTLEAGATVSALGQTANLPDSGTGAVFSLTDGGTGPSESAVVAAAGNYQFLPGAPGKSTVTLGACPSAASCSGGVTLASDGFVGIFSGGSVTQAGPVTFEAASLILGAPSINLSADTYPGYLPAGITLTQTELTGLLANSPAVRSLDLMASQSINLFGAVQFGQPPTTAATGSPLQLILDTPAIYGAGASGDMATLAADTIVWTNSSGAPGLVYPGSPGNGAGGLTLDARQIVIGYAPASQPQDQTTIARTALGFSGVTLIGTEEVTGNNHASLAVYQAESAYSTATLGPVYTGGSLAIDTPLLTTAPGAVVSYTAGAGVTLAGAAGAPAATLPGGLGGEIDVSAPVITDTTRVALPSGKLVLDAAGDVTLGAGSATDLAGPAVTFFDVTRGSWGGTLLIESAGGNITEAAGSSIDVSAQLANAGTISATALSGTVTLAGTVQGIAAGYRGGAIDLRGFGLAGAAGSFSTPAAFMAFNTALDQGGFGGGRSFELAGPGDITIPLGGTVTAQAVSIAVDRGALDVLGTIDASGSAPGTIRLAGAGGVLLGAGSLLDAQGRVLQCASGPCSQFVGNPAQDQPVDALNAAFIEVNVPASVSANGTSFVPNTAGLTIAPGATIDILSPDPTADGRIELDVPRSSRTAGANISAAGPVTVLGATRYASLDVNAFWAYSPDNAPFLAGGILTQAAFGTPAAPGPVEADAQSFIGNALGTGLLGGKLAGLASYADAFHLRPGVEIDGSADVAGGALTVQGDIDLSGFRFAGVNPGTPMTGAYGSGEPGVLWLRAPGTLNVFGSINDGFAPPPATPDDQGWVLRGGIPAGQSIVLPVTVYLGSGTVFPKTATLGYEIHLAAGTLAAGSVAPTQLQLTASNPQPFVANVRIGVYAAGETVPAGGLARGSFIPAGARFPFKIDFAPVKWPGGAPLSLLSSPATLDQPGSKPLTLTEGDVIPAGSKLVLTDDKNNPVRSVQLRPDNAGQIWGVSRLLPAGNLSWSLRLVGGAELGGADSQAVQAASALAAEANFADPSPGSVAFSDLHVPNAAAGARTVDFSVVRTGSGYLDVVAGGNVSEATPFGIYTAGTQSADVGAEYDQSRVGKNGTVLGKPGRISLNGASYESAVSATYQANYPTNGGNLFVAAGGTVTGDVYELGPTGYATTVAGSTPPVYSNDVSNWLWWQGGPSVPAAWWINFGTYVNLANANSGVTAPTLTGFTGFGALGGGNVIVRSGGDAGLVAPQASTSTATAVDLAVASTGRADTASQAVLLTGGGDVDGKFGGALNRGAALASVVSGRSFFDSTYGVITDLRGQIAIQAGAVGQVRLTYDDISSTALFNPASGLYIDPRSDDPLLSKTFNVGGGPVIVVGDAQADVQARGDLALSAAGNPTLGYQTQRPAERSYFSIWQDNTSIALASAGGNIVPATPYGGSLGVNDTVSQSGALNNPSLLLYPPTLDVQASSGSVFIQQDNTATVNGLELAPAPRGQLEFLAGTSIYDVGDPASSLFLQTPIDISGAATAPGDIPAPLDPGVAPGRLTGVGFFGFEQDVATGVLHGGDPAPARFYAVSGDIIGLQSGGVTFDDKSDQVAGYIAAKAVQVKAGGDIVSLGLSQQLAGIYTNNVPSGIVLNNNPSDVSAIEAGNDIIASSAIIAGPGVLIEQAGHNVDQGDQGFLDSIGEIGSALTPATRNSGAGITVLAGIGPGVNYSGFADQYLNPANLADPTTPLQNQPGHVERTYQTQLLAFLQQRFGYTGTQAGALAAFQALPPDQRTVFLLSVYFTELNQSGLDYNNPASRFYQSYLEGQEAIRTLFPNTDQTGKSPASGGGLIAFSGSVFTQSANNPNVSHTVDGGIRTDFGGGITTLVPYGTTVLGNYGIVPGALSGVVTQGSGDIDAYSYGSVILGQSRILTTFGGNILIWMSSDGEINAGRGSSNTVLAPPLSVSYDQFGNILLSPTVPSSGAGIGTLAPIAQVAPGDLNLIAPFGTVDAGEAGIRASGNANIAARVVLNAANIAVGGKTVGIPSAPTISASAASAASAAAGSATTAAQQTSPRATPVQEPSDIEVDVISISGGEAQEVKRRRQGPGGPV